MGTLMCIGLTTANSILVVTFANQRMDAGDDPLVAAATAGYTRLRPVLMTAGAMILGMIPMALGVGEGGEQNAPLARAVIGGLLFATFATLVFVPAMYRLLRRQPAAAASRRLSPRCKCTPETAGTRNGARRGVSRDDHSRVVTAETADAKAPCRSITRPQHGGRNARKAWPSRAVVLAVGISAVQHWSTGAKRA